MSQYGNCLGLCNICARLWLILLIDILVCGPSYPVPSVLTRKPLLRTSWSIDVQLHDTQASAQYDHTYVAKLVHKCQA